jgi:hypothetical protein
MRQVVHAHRHEIRRCMEPVFNPDPSRRRLTLVLVVAPDGHVESATIEEATWPDTVVACVRDHATAWKFAKSATGTTCRWPFPIN